MSKYNVHSDLPISMALWLSYDEYDYVDKENYISVTNLLKPTRQAVLSHRIKSHPLFKDKKYDLLGFFASRMGTALHNSIDMTWDKHVKVGMRSLGYPEDVIEKVVVFNEDTGLPSDEELQKLRDEGKIIVAKEIRMYRKFGPYIIGGKPDFIFDGQVEDFKSVKTWAYGDQVKELKELKQISIYRWIKPELITNNIGRISQAFMDWMKGKAAMPNYPPIPVISKEYVLLSEEEVEAFIQARIDDLEAHVDVPEKELPRCTPEDLWQGKTSYKYYGSAEAANKPGGRSLKNFDNLADAESHRINKGKGVIKMIEGKVKACNYCGGFEICSQKDEYINNGLLTVDE